MKSTSLKNNESDECESLVISKGRSHEKTWRKCLRIFIDPTWGMTKRKKTIYIDR